MCPYDIGEVDLKEFERLLVVLVEVVIGILLFFLSILFLMVLMLFLCLFLLGFFPPGKDTLTLAIKEQS